MPLLRMWVHSPRASNGLLPRRSNLVGYVRWDARSDRFPPCETIIPTTFRSQSDKPTSRALGIAHFPSLVFIISLVQSRLRFLLSRFRRIVLVRHHLKDPAQPER